MKKPSVAESRLSAFFSTLSAELRDRQQIDASPSVDRFLLRATKKARFTGTDLRQKAVDGFVELNSSLSNFTLSLSQDQTRNAKHFITVVLERYTSLVCPSELYLDGKTYPNVQETLNEDFLYDNWRFGPGASHEVSGTHVVDKIIQNMTCTTRAIPRVHRLRRTNPYFLSLDAHNGSDGILEIRGSKLDTVPKNQDTERTIAIEPSGNMVLKLAAGLYLEGALRYIGLDIRKQQPINKALAYSGSITGRLATLDLKSASDRISVDLVRALMPTKWFDLLMSLRSEEIKLPNGEWVKLNMISTMGNGFTFPLMTLLLVSLIYAYRCDSRSRSVGFIDWSETAVFGDDIIIPVGEYEICKDTLLRAGFVINDDKSYRDGFFRESCGGDYYAGQDVTPVYVRSLRDDSEIYVAINQLLGWCARNRTFLPRSIMLLRGMLQGSCHLIPEWCSETSGILCRSVKRRYKLLETLQDPKIVSDDHWFLLPLASGGYVYSSGRHIVGLPRPDRNTRRSRVAFARLPKGYLDGWDPVTRSFDESRTVELYVELTTPR